MIRKISKGQYISPVLDQIQGIRHVFCGRHFNDCQNLKNWNTCLSACGFEPFQASYVHQVHGNSVVCVTEENYVIRKQDGDGLAAVRHRTPDAVLTVQTADCVPILLADPVACIIAAVHSGWVGTANKIAAAAVSLMVSNGSKPSNIIAAFGPHIGPCCYNVDSVRADRFEHEHPECVIRSSSGIFLHLAGINREILKATGLTDGHIDSDVMCTSCHSDEFYSYRKDSLTNHGEQISIIGFK